MKELVNNWGKLYRKTVPSMTIPAMVNYAEMDMIAKVVWHPLSNLATIHPVLPSTRTVLPPIVMDHQIFIV